MKGLIYTDFNGDSPSSVYHWNAWICNILKILQRILYTSVAFNSNGLNYSNILVFNFQKQQRPTKYPVWNNNVPITMWAEMIGI